MREKGRDLGKGRALGSYKMPQPPGHLVLGICHFTLSMRWSLQFPELPIPRTLQIINHPSPHSYGGSTRIQRLPSLYKDLQTCPRLIELTENHDEGL